MSRKYSVVQNVAWIIMPTLCNPSISQVTALIAEDHLAAFWASNLITKGTCPLIPPSSPLMRFNFEGHPSQICQSIPRSETGNSGQPCMMIDACLWIDCYDAYIKAMKDWETLIIGTDLPDYSDTFYSDTPLTVTLLACPKWSVCYWTSSGYSDNLVTVTLFPCSKSVTVSGWPLYFLLQYSYTIGLSKSSTSRLREPYNVLQPRNIAFIGHSKWFLNMEIELCAYWLAKQCGKRQGQKIIGLASELEPTFFCIALFSHFEPWQYGLLLQQKLLIPEALFETTLLGFFVNYGLSCVIGLLGR